MSTFKCPHCGSILTYRQNCQTACFAIQGWTTNSIESSAFSLNTYYCPECSNPTIFFTDRNERLNGFNTCIFPQSLAKKFPDYVPLQIREDYEEAYAILHLSPKASATLSRRCLQGMIHDFHNVHEKNLNAEITALKDKVSPREWSVLDSMRSLGNIGAHMEHDINLIIDIDPSEAEKLLKVIEHFIEKWYVSRHETETLFDDVIKIGQDKQAQREK